MLLNTWTGNGINVREDTGDSHAFSEPYAAPFNVSDVPFLLQSCSCIRLLAVTYC